MPDGRRHTIANATIATVAFGSLFVYSPHAAFWCATGALSSIMLTPDQDLPGNITYYYMRKYCGVPAEFVWKCIWLVYSHAFKHRSFWSHFPIVSTAIRLLYLSAFVLPVWLYLQLPLPHFSVALGWWLIGLGLGDFTHFWLDYWDNRLGGRL